MVTTTAVPSIDSRDYFRFFTVSSKVQVDHGQFFIGASMPNSYDWYPCLFELVSLTIIARRIESLHDSDESPNLKVVKKRNLLNLTYIKVIVCGYYKIFSIDYKYIQ